MELRSFDDVLNLVPTVRKRSQRSDSQDSLINALRTLVRPRRSKANNCETIRAQMREINFQLLQTGFMPFDAFYIQIGNCEVYRHEFWKHCRSNGIRPSDEMEVTIYWG